MKRTFKAYDRVRAYGYGNSGNATISFPHFTDNPERMDIKGNVVAGPNCSIVPVICDDGQLRYYHASQLRRLKRKAKA